MSLLYSNGMKPEDEAVLCGRASEAIYGTVADTWGMNSSKAAMAALGFSNFLWIDLPTLVLDVCAFIATSDRCHILVFRGTKTPQDWMTDAMCTPIGFESVFNGAPPIGEIHSGFGRCLAEGLQRIILPLSHRDRTRPLLITGHSLGGALAALSSACFSVLNCPIPPVSTIYTFGQPRIGLRNFCDDFKRRLQGKLVRFVNKQDIVPRVPFRIWDYSDEGKMIHFDSSGKPLLESPEWQDFTERAWQSAEDFVEIVTNLRVDVGDHSIVGYRKLIEAEKETLALLLKNN